MPNNAIRLRRVATMLVAAGFVAPLWANQSGPIAPVAPVSAPAAPQAAQDSAKQLAVSDSTPTNPSTSATAPHSGAKVVEVIAGTHIPLVLHNAISTKSARHRRPRLFRNAFPRNGRWPRRDSCRLLRERRSYRNEARRAA